MNRRTFLCALTLGTLGATPAAEAQPAEVYGWFTEGFDTRDLQEARAFLDELS